MPIYAYRCDSCGFEKDVLQKISDAPLTQCPSCGNDAFRKQVTAAGFQLKGSGWYVTDFRGGNGSNGGKNAPATGSKAAGEASSSSDGGKAAGGDSSAGSGSDSTTAAASASTAAGTAGGS